MNIRENSGSGSNSFLSHAVLSLEMGSPFSLMQFTPSFQLCQSLMGVSVSDPPRRAVPAAAASVSNGRPSGDREGLLPAVSAHRGRAEQAPLGPSGLMSDAQSGTGRSSTLPEL